MYCKSRPTHRGNTHFSLRPAKLATLGGNPYIAAKGYGQSLGQAEAVNGSDYLYYFKNRLNYPILYLPQ